MPNEKLFLALVSRLDHRLFILARGLQTLRSVNQRVQHGALSAAGVAQRENNILLVDHFQRVENDLETARDIVQIAL